MYKILLVEDENIIRETLAEILELNNFEVKAVESAEKALIVLKKWIPEIIISDVMMLGMNGFDLLRAVKKNDEIKKIPFIFLSALTNEKDYETAKELGADRFITKPFKTKEVIEIMMEYLNK